MQILKNSIINLRAIEPSDINFIYNSENNFELWELSNTSKPFSKYILNEYIENSHKDIFTTKQIRFIIETTAEKKVVGMIDLFDYEPIHLRVGIGIYIINDEQRNNYATNSIEIIKKYCLKVLRINQIYCNISSDNEASIKLFEKAGFTFSGIKKQWLNTANGFKDVLFYQLLF